MEYELSIYKRLVLATLLPPGGDYYTARVLRELEHDLPLSEAEALDAQLTRSDDGNLNWQRPIPDKIVEIGDIGRQMLCPKLLIAAQQMHEQEAIKPEFLDLLDMFGLEFTPAEPEKPDEDAGG